MEYLNALARGLDGASSYEIETMLKELPPEARTGVANAFQLISTDKVKAAVGGDADIAAHGAPELLPRKMYESLASTNRAVWWTEKVDGVSIGEVEKIELNGVTNNLAAAHIADWSSPELRHGTGLDAAVMAAASDYLDAQEFAAGSNGDVEFVVDGFAASPDLKLTEEMFHALANDRAVVSAALSAEGGEALLDNVFKREWPDDGETISELFDISAQNAIAVAGDRPDELRAQQSGHIAESVARYISDYSDSLLHMPDGDVFTIGGAQPRAGESLAEDLSPYFNTIAGSGSIAGVGHFETTNELADMYSVLATNPEAGVQAAIATYAQENALAAVYGGGYAYGTYGQIAGQMQHSLEAGTASAALKALDAVEVYRADWEQAVNSADYGAARTFVQAVVSAFPGAAWSKTSSGWAHTSSGHKCSASSTPRRPKQLAPSRDVHDAGQYRHYLGEHRGGPGGERPVHHQRPGVGAVPRHRCKGQPLYRRQNRRRQGGDRRPARIALRAKRAGLVRQLQRRHERWKIHPRPSALIVCAFSRSLVVHFDTGDPGQVASELPS
jgi:hypothetical protein